MKTRINESKIEYQVNLNWLGVEIRKLKNKLKLVKPGQREMIRQVISSSEALYHWAERLEKNNIIFGWSAGVLEAAARAIDNPSDENIWLLKFAISSPYPKTVRPDKTPIKSIKKSASSSAIKKMFVIRKLHSMPKLLNCSRQINTLMPAFQAMDDPGLITVSDDHAREQAQVFLSSEKTIEDTPSCYFELTKLKALAVSFVMAIVVAASVILALKTLGFSAAVQYGCGCIGGAGTFFLGRLLFNNAPANVQVMKSVGRESESQSDIIRESKATNSSLDEITEKQLPHLLKDYAGLLKM